MDSAGLLLYRVVGERIEVLLAHMGGPFWASKDDRAWSVPKGLAEEHETDLLAVAEREFAEELGRRPPVGPTVALGTVRSGRKTVHAFAREGDFDADHIVSNTFTMEWPRGSGRTGSFPEVDRAAWLDLTTARVKLVGSQVPFLDRLVEAVG